MAHACGLMLTGRCAIPAEEVNPGGAMGNFQAIIANIGRSQETEPLLERIRTGTAAERDTALADLASLASARNDIASWGAAGIGYHLAGDTIRAIQIFEELVKHAPKQAQDTCRLNLATFYSQAEEIALCRHHLLHLAEHGSTAEMREIGREQLDGYDAFLGNTDQDRRLRAVQLRSLRGAIASPRRTADDFVKLAHLLRRSERLDPNERFAREIVEVLERGHAAFPDNVKLLELLVSGYLRHDPEDRLDVALKALEQLAPDSEGLRILADSDGQRTEAFSSRMSRRAEALLQNSLEGELPTRQAALRDLGSLVATFPENPFHRLKYAFGLMMIGRNTEALEQAANLAQRPVATHSFHFNLAQVFWNSGDPRSGREHIRQALHYASNDAERNDVADLVALLESQSP